MFNQCTRCHKTLKGLGVIKNDTHLISAWDIPVALVLLTRLPLPALPEQKFARQQQAVWAFPIAGLLVGLLAGAIGWIGLAAQIPGSICAVLAVATLILLTGAMHEDGFADTADGLWGGFTKERRLEIMKDSHIGTYGVLALILSQLLRILAVGALFGSGAIWGLVAAATWSRALMPTLMCTLPNARGSGLSHRVGTPPTRGAALGLFLALLICLLMIGAQALVPMMVAGLAAFILAAIAKRKIGGQTGDILGATQQMSEIAFLVALIVQLN